MDAKLRETTQAAVNDLTRISNMFRGLFALGDELRSLLSLDQAAQEAKNRLEDASKQRDEILRQNSKAAEDARRGLDQASAQRDDLLRQHREVKTEIASAEATLAQLRAEIRAKNTEHAAVRDRHAAFLASIKGV